MRNAPLTVEEFSYTFNQRPKGLRGRKKSVRDRAEELLGSIEDTYRELQEHQATCLHEEEHVQHERQRNRHFCNLCGRVGFDNFGGMKS